MRDRTQQEIEEMETARDLEEDDALRIAVGGSSPPEKVSLRAERGIRATPDQQLHFLIRDVLPVLSAVAAGYVYDPGSSDLDDEQPITLRMTLGNYRRASRLKWELEKAK